MTSDLPCSRIADDNDGPVLEAARPANVLLVVGLELAAFDRVKRIHLRIDHIT